MKIYLWCVLLVFVAGLAGLRPWVVNAQSMNAGTHSQQCDWLHDGFWTSDDVNNLVELCLTNGKNLDMVDQEGRSFLHHVVQHTRANDTVVIGLLGLIDVNATDHQGNTALHLAVIHGKRPNLVKLLVSEGADPDLARLDGNTPLHIAAIEKRSRQAEALLEIGAKPDILNDLGQAPLHIAVLNNNMGISKALLLAGAKPDILNDLGQAPLHIAVLNNNMGISKALLLAGAEVDIRDAEGNMPLHLATIAGTKRHIWLLLDAGASRDARDASGQTPAAYVPDGSPIAAIFDGDDFASDILCNWFSAEGFWRTTRNIHVRMKHCIDELGFVVNTADSSGLTVLHRLMQFAPGEGRVVDFLVEKGADVNAAGPTGITPLHMSVLPWTRRGTRALIDNGSDVNARDEEGLTPMHGAAAFGRVNQLKLLIDNGGLVDARSAEGLTPLHSAAAACQAEAVELLLDQGADATATTTDGVRPETFANESPGTQRCKRVVFDLLKSADALFDYGEDCDNNTGRIEKQVGSVAISTALGCIIGAAPGIILSILSGDPAALKSAIEGCIVGGGLSGIASGAEEQATGGNCKFNISILVDSRVEF